MLKLTKCDLYDREFFCNLYKSTSIEDFVEVAAYPLAQTFSNITRDDLVEILQLAMNNVVDPSLKYYMALFDANVTMPGAFNLIFHLPEDWPDVDGYPGAEEIVDYVLS
jgi:hypothetical protein